MEDKEERKSQISMDLHCPPSHTALLVPFLSQIAALWKQCPLQAISSS